MKMIETIISYIVVAIAILVSMGLWVLAFGIVWNWIFH